MTKMHTPTLQILTSVTLLGLLTNLTLGGHVDVAHKCRFARSPYKVLASFANDEQSLHNRERREAVEDRTNLVHEIEDLHRSTNPDPVLLSGKRAEYCDLVDFIDPEVTCDVESKFRTITGECNNLNNQTWGRSSTPFRRLMSADYKDGVSTPRDFTRTARTISAAFVGNEAIPSLYSESELLVHMGQFLDHDLNLTPMIRTVCTCEGGVSCISIQCAEDDPVCGAQECIPLPRSLPLLPRGVPCDSDVTDNLDLSRIQINGITSFLDGSNVYGSHPETEAELRMFTGGNLTTVEGADPNNEEHIRLLPPDKENEECIVGASAEKCGKGGDIRAAEQPTLTAIHTLFVNQHNRIASELTELNPGWNDERLYQEARKIVGALLQRIIYAEWLPLVLGKDTMNEYDLAIWNEYKGYDETLDPSITTDFASSFLRFGHSMVPEELQRVTPYYVDKHEDVQLKDAFFNAAIVHDLGNGGINSLLLGTLEKKLLKVDRHFSESVNIHLFKNEEIGLDLIAMNIQRGRDHGLPSYLEYRNAFTDDKFEYTTFGQLRTIMDEEAVDAFETVYSCVDEIEPFVGMLAENHLAGALVGKTLAAVLAGQFHVLKHGDRFWYENPEGPQAFTKKQLFSINCVTLARIICDNVNVQLTQPAAFKLDEKSPGFIFKFFFYMINNQEYPESNGGMNGFINKRVSCYDTFSLPILDLEPWRE